MQINTIIHFEFIQRYQRHVCMAACLNDVCITGINKCLFLHKQVVYDIHFELPFRSCY